ncbi:hypothetical protein Afil01_61960 [Actinorhabdospora filicis]|uniref:Uncharacterized protein n=1 Tax=Actinorhabdospora filicis TaxID=1785913 RepID=A0A9W6SR37_9ACTN|nr:hypothetical protein [Actinorhabdospora filicis]GLZ81389.1 hypothetical protein Afil01_61960 [Actinorhabdospora filicis]
MEATFAATSVLAWIDCIGCAREGRPLGRAIPAAELSRYSTADLHDGGIAPAGHTEFAVTELRGFHGMAVHTDPVDVIENTARALAFLEPDDRPRFAAYMRLRRNRTTPGDGLRFRNRITIEALIRQREKATYGYPLPRPADPTD